MPYDPGISYHGDQYAYQGIQALGSGIKDAFDKYQQEQEKKQQLAAQVQGADLIVSHARQTGLIAPDDFLKYQTADAKGKLEISDALAKNIATDSILQQRNQAQQLQQAQIQNYAADQNYKNAALTQQFKIATLKQEPDPNAGKPIIHPLTGQPIGIYDSNGRPSYYPEDTKNTKPSVVDPLIDPVTKKAVEGKGVVRLTGAVVSTTSGTPVLETDPTGTFYFDRKGNPHPVPAGTVLAQKLGGANPAQPAPGILQRIFGAVTGAGGLSPAPTPLQSAANAPDAAAIQQLQADAARAIAAGAPADAVNKRLSDKLKELGVTAP